MDDNKDHTPDSRMNFCCDYRCETCGHSSQCVLYAFERLGRKFRSQKEEAGDKDYERLVTELEAAFTKTLDIVRKKRECLLPLDLAEKDENTISRPGTEEDSIIGICMEFTDGSYKLLKSIRDRERLPMELLFSLRSLQFHHVLLTTKLCRTVADIVKKQNLNIPVSRAEFRDANDSLGICRNALREIALTLPEERRAVSKLLDLSEKIEKGIREQFS